MVAQGPLTFQSMGLQVSYTQTQSTKAAISHNNTLAPPSYCHHPRTAPQQHSYHVSMRTGGPTLKHACSSRYTGHLGTVRGEGKMPEADMALHCLLWSCGGSSDRRVIDHTRRGVVRDDCSSWLLCVQVQGISKGSGMRTESQSESGSCLSYVCGLGPCCCSGMGSMPAGRLNSQENRKGGGVIVQWNREVAT